MPYYLYRPTPLHDWQVSVRPPADGETMHLGDCTWFSQAQAEADRLNGKGNSEQKVLGL